MLHILLKFSHYKDASYKLTVYQDRQDSKAATVRHIETWSGSKCKKRNSKWNNVSSS